MKRISIFIAASLFFASCSKQQTLSEQYPNIVDIAIEWDEKKENPRGAFTDAGAWMSFNIPQEKELSNYGFYGSYDLDMHKWLAKSFMSVDVANTDGKWNITSTNYIPGAISMTANKGDVTVEQTLRFISNSQALLHVKSSKSNVFEISSIDSKERCAYIWNNNQVMINIDNGENMFITPSVEMNFANKNGEYGITTSKPQSEMWLVLSHSFDAKRYNQGDIRAMGKTIAQQPEEFSKTHSVDRWEQYLSSSVRKDTPNNYNRVAAKSVVTLISNWRAAKKDLTRDGIVPSHAVNYFVGYWAWDTWKEVVATVRFNPELAKEAMHSMFDFQDSLGMVADCVYTNAKENNYRDTKPPLAAWAVNEIYEQTNDVEYLREIYPKLLKYYNWWFEYRDNNKNGICEYGSTDGTAIAAKWESGMDNSVRFDEVNMNKITEGAWSMDQESADLNAYLAYEGVLLTKLSKVIGVEFKNRLLGSTVAEYFFNPEVNFFTDKEFDGTLINYRGSDGWTPLWTEVATKEQAALMYPTMNDPKHFATYIPFPTLSRAHPRFDPRGYWRGPIWLDQTYFAISGLRKYGYVAEADKYTAQVLTRCEGIAEGKPIFENYDADTGKGMQAPHFSWSAAHLLMLYWEMDAINDKR